MMKKARNGDNVRGSQEIADFARRMARKYDLCILEPSLDDLNRITQHEILKRASPGKISPPRIVPPGV